MNSEQQKEAKFDFWKKDRSLEIEKRFCSQVAIAWCLLAILTIINLNLYSPVGKTTHLYKPEMARVLYDDADTMTRILRDEITTTTGDTQ